MWSDVLLHVLSSPFILFFGLGILSGLIRSDLEFPEAFTRALSLYIMLAIGLKGGIGLAKTSLHFSDLAALLVTGILLSFFLPFLAYVLLRKATRSSRLDAAAIAAHYGSVSVVTFNCATMYLDMLNLPYQDHFVTLLALMESPAIFSGLILAKFSRRLQESKRAELLSPHLLREIFCNGSSVLLLGGVAIGFLAEPTQLQVVKPFLVDPFHGILCLFLLDMGLLVTRYTHNLKSLSLPLLAFGLYMPIIGASIGLVLAKMLGLEASDSLLFMVLSASASYIAVPAAIRVALPKSNPLISMTLSLGITFPFNITLGIPLYWYALNFFSK
jgi:hypothetical protein